MKRAALLFQVFCLASFVYAGFKPKNIRPKKPDNYQVEAEAAGVTYAADLLLKGNQQKDFFYKELTGAGVIAIRLAIFNNGGNEVVLPLDGIQLLGPGGKELPMVAPEVVADAVLQGVEVTAQARRNESPVQVAPSIRRNDPRTDRTDPRYDPRLDPTDPSYDPNDPGNRGNGDPRYNDPRYDPRYGGYGRPGVDVILNPRVGGGGESTSRFEKQVIAKDFSDKAHTSDPVDGMMIRDRFLYFSLKDRPATEHGFTLRIPKSKGIPQEVTLIF
jgi:hypothetical protein